MSGKESAKVSQDCRRKALDLLARRPHFGRELETKLASRRFPASAIEETLRWLEQQGFVDDPDSARRWVAGVARRKGFGPRRMRAELQRRGVAGETVSEVLAEEWREGESERTLEAARVWLKTRRWDAAALARHLERKGFNGGPIRGALAELREKAAEMGA
ncbi:MAG: recombination regulator RecX [Acidobacteriota bacterium]|nr:recombination regulator RecX [Acidobacteriota bacterium]